MKLIVAGSRYLPNKINQNGYVEFRDSVFAAINSIHSRFIITQIVHGGAKGADTLGKQWAIANGIDHKAFEADWDKGRAAGPIRNKLMAQYGDSLLAFPLTDPDKAKGTTNMISEAKLCGLGIIIGHVEETVICSINNIKSYKIIKFSAIKSK